MEYYKKLNTAPHEQFPSLAFCSFHYRSRLSPLMGKSRREILQQVFFVGIT